LLNEARSIFMHASTNIDMEGIPFIRERDVNEIRDPDVNERRERDVNEISKKRLERNT